MPGPIALPVDSYAPPLDSLSKDNLLVNGGVEPSLTPSGATNGLVRGPHTFSHKIALTTSVAMFIFIFMTIFIAVFAFLRFSVSVLVIAAVAALWETTYTGSFPDRKYFTKALIEYLQAGATGACIFAAAFGLILALAGVVSVFSPRVLARMQEMQKSRALVGTAKRSKPTMSHKRCLYASVSFLSTFFIAIGVPASRWWSSGGLELLMQDPKRSFAAAVLGDLLVSLWTWARIYMRGEEKGSEDGRDESEKAGMLEEVVVGMPNV